MAEDLGTANLKKKTWIPSWCSAINQGLAAKVVLLTLFMFEPAALAGIAVAGEVKTAVLEVLLRVDTLLVVLERVVV